jgi:hypothetical protein
MSRRPYYDDDREHQTQRSSNKSLLLILGIGAGVLGVCLVICGGLVYLGLKAWSDAVSSGMAMANSLPPGMEDSEEVAEQFMSDLADGRVDLAYARTTKEFQARQPLPQFRAFVGRNPALKNYESDSLVPTNSSPAMVTFEGSVTGPNGAEVSFTIQVIKDGEVCKVNRFTIP